MDYQKADFTTLFQYLGVYRYPLGWCLVLTLGILWMFFGEVLIAPNDYMFATSGDGLNIYFSSAYFIKYIPEGVHHTGASYPYGNHLIYDDVNPLLSLILRSLSNLFPSIKEYIIGCINLSILLAFFPGVIFMYWILRRVGLPIPYAIISSLIIIFFSPQIERFTGHLTLSYVCYVPMLWYVNLRIWQDRHYQWALISHVALVGCFSFIHPYYFLIGSGFLFSYTLVYLLQHTEEFKKRLLTCGGILFAGILPGLILKGWEALTQIGATDFVDYPYGFLLFTSSFKQIFFSSHDPLYTFWDKVFNIKPNPWEEWLKWEGVAYVGITGLIILLGWVARLMHLLFRRKLRWIGQPVLPEPLKTGIWATTLLLIWAMGFPFNTFPELLDLISFLRQFRSQGRLTWPFYYVYMSLGVYILFAFWKMMRRRGSKHAWAFVHMWVLLALIAWSMTRWVDLLGAVGYGWVALCSTGILLSSYWAIPVNEKVKFLSWGFVLSSVGLAVYWVFSFQATPPVWLKYMLPIIVLLMMGIWMWRMRSMVYRANGSGLVGLFVCMLGIGVWAWEARTMLQQKREFILSQKIETAYPEWLVDYDSLLVTNGYRTSDFQAILSFPFFHFGTQKFTLTSFHSTRHANAVAYQTGLPMLNTLVARAPLTPSLRLLQLVSDPAIEKEILNDLPDDRPILLLYSHESLAPNEQAYVAASDSITQIYNIRIAKLELKNIPDTRKEVHEEFRTIKDSLPIYPLYEKGTLRSTQALSGFVWEHVGDRATPLGKEVWHTENKKDTLFDGKLMPDVVDSVGGSGAYEFSLWMKIDTRSHFLPALLIEQYEGDTRIDLKPLELKMATNVYQDWMRADMSFYLQKPTNRIVISTFEKVDMLTVDNLMIRPEGVDVYLEQDGMLWKNNVMVD